MGIFSAILGKQSLGEIINETKNNLFEIYQIKNPTNAETFNAILMITIAGVAMINDVAKGKANFLIDKLSQEAKQLTNSLTFEIREVANSDEEVIAIYEVLPPDMQGDEGLRINGGVAFPSIFNSIGPNFVTEILQNSEGEFGSPGYAGIIIGDALLGRDESIPYFAQTVMEMNNLLKKIIKTI